MTAEFNLKNVINSFQGEKNKADGGGRGEGKIKCEGHIVEGTKEGQRQNEKSDDNRFNGQIYL